MLLAEAMPVWKLVLLALGAAFALALVAWLFARLVRKPLESAAAEASQDPKLMALLYPPWGYWLHSAMILIGLLSDHWMANQGRYKGPVGMLLAVALAGVTDTLHCHRLLQKSTTPEELRPILRRWRKSSLIAVALFFLISMYFLSR